MSTPKKQTTQSWFDGMMQKIAPGLNPEEVEILKTDFDKRYTEAVGSTTEALNTPRTSTAPQSVEQYRETRAVNTDAGEADFTRLYKPKAELLDGLADNKADREVRVHGGKLDNHTRNVLAIQGGTGMDALRLGHSTGDRRQQREIDYREGFNRDVLDVYKDALAQEQAQANRGFIKDLALTAGMLFID